MTDIAQFVDRVQSRRTRRREPLDASPGMRGTVSGIDSQAMMDAAQGADIMDAAPDTRLRGSAPMRVEDAPAGEEGMVDILPGGQLRQSAPPQQETPDGQGVPVQEVGLFGRRGGVFSRPAPKSNMVCTNGQCFPAVSSAPMISEGRVISQEMPMVVSEGIAAAPPMKVGDIIRGTLQQRKYDIDPSSNVDEMPMYTPDSLFQAGLQAFDYAEERLNRGDKGAAIAAVQGYHLAQSLFQESSTMFQDRQTFKIMEARMAAADKVISMNTPVGKMKLQMEALSDARFPVRQRAMMYVANVSQQMAVEGISDGAKAQQTAAMQDGRGLYKEGVAIATGYDVARIYLANRLDRPGEGQFTDPARLEQAEISRTKALNLIDSALRDAEVPLEQFPAYIREVVGRSLEPALRTLHESQKHPNPDVAAQAEADEYATRTAETLIEARAK